MALTAAQEVEIEGPPDLADSEVMAALVRWDQDPLRAALELWKRRRNEMIADPLSWTAAGDYSEDFSKNLIAVDSRIRELESKTGLGLASDANLPTMGVTSFSRDDRERL